MSQENVELVRRGKPLTRRGNRRYPRLAGEPLAAYPDLSIEIDGVRDLEDVTVADVRLRGHGGGSNAPVEQEQWHVARWRHEKIIWWRVFLTDAEALEAAEHRE